MLPVRAGTLVMLFVALLFGGVAVLLARLWLSSQEVAGTQQALPQAVKVESQKVVVAKGDLRFGEPITPEKLGEADWPREAVPEGSFTSVADITKDGARFVLTPMTINEPILDWKISGPGARASLSSLVAKGMRAVTIRVNETTGVGGFVLPGDRVDVLYRSDRSDGAGIDVLFQNVRVLAVNQVADEKTGTPIEGRNATLELTPFDAQKLALAESTGMLVFTLRSAGSVDVAPAGRVVQGELVSNAALSQSPSVVQAEDNSDFERRLAELESKLKKAQAQQVVASTKAEVEAASDEALPTTAQVTIFRGLQGSSYTVPLDANQ